MSIYGDKAGEDWAEGTAQRNVPGAKLRWRRRNAQQSHRRENAPSKFNGIHRRRRKKIRL